MYTSVRRSGFSPSLSEKFVGRDWPAQRHPLAFSRFTVVSAIPSGIIRNARLHIHVRKGKLPAATVSK